MTFRFLLKNETRTIKTDYLYEKIKKGLYTFLDTFTTAICSAEIVQDLQTVLRATAETAIARLSHRNSVRLSVRPSVCPSVTRVDQAKTVQARIINSTPSAAPKTIVSGSVTLFQKIHRGHPNRGP